MIIYDVEQNTPEWDELRAGRPTSSEFSKLLTGTGKQSTQIGDYAATLAAEQFAGKPLERWEGNRATERGHEVEPEARHTYEFLHGIKVERVGFVTNHGAGSSPDGFVLIAGIHEVKCQLPKGHVQTMAYYRKHEKCPPAHYTQCQGQLLICEREWVDLDFYHPDLPGLTIRVNRDESYIDELLKQIEEVIAQRDDLLLMLEAA